MIVLGRGIILVGDKNVPGGTVMTGSPTDTVFGRAIARIGDLVNCPLHGINKIIEGCPTFTAMGVPVALDGHASECGCALVSSFGGGGSLGSENLSMVSSDNSSKFGDQPVNSKRYDEQIKFLLSSGALVTDTAYTLILDDGSEVSGVTDTEGKTARIETDEPRVITKARLKPEQVFCCTQTAENMRDSNQEEIEVALERIETNTQNFGSSVKEHTVDEDTRSLTTGEIEMAKKIFRGSVDYSKVKVHNGAAIIGAGNNAMTPNGEMYFPKDFYKPDYSIGKDPDKIWFIHEMTHVWQYQLGYSVIWAGFKILLKGGYGYDTDQSTPRAYKYDAIADTNKAMSDFNMEQQGDLVSGYFDAVFLSGEGSQPHQTHVMHLPFLQKILVNFLQNPSDTSLLPNTTSF